MAKANGRPGFLRRGTLWANKPTGTHFVLVRAYRKGKGWVARMAPVWRPASADYGLEAEDVSLADAIDAVVVRPVGRAGIRRFESLGPTVAEHHLRFAADVCAAERRAYVEGT